MFENAQKWDQKKRKLIRLNMVVTDIINDQKKDKICGKINTKHQTTLLKSNTTQRFIQNTKVDQNLNSRYEK